MGGDGGIVILARCEIHFIRESGVMHPNNSKSICTNLIDVFRSYQRRTLNKLNASIEQADEQSSNNVQSSQVR